MSRLLANNYRFRHSYATTLPALDVENLINIQIQSYHDFLQSGLKPEERLDVGLQAVFKSVFPIHDFNGRATLEFLKYELQEPNNDVDECREKGLTFAAQLKVHVCMNIFEEDEETKEKMFMHAQRQQVFFGDIPLMTDNGTFIINGTERVVVSQLHRSPGVFFSYKLSKTTLEQKQVLTARIIPNRGSWIDFEFDTKDRLHVRIDRRKKLPAVYLLLALDYEINQLLSYFYPIEMYNFDGNDWTKTTTKEGLARGFSFGDFEYSVTTRGRKRKRVVKKGKKFLKNHIRDLTELGFFEEKEIDVLGKKETFEFITLPSDITELVKEAEPYRYAAYDIVDEMGEIIIPCNTPLTQQKVEEALNAGITEFPTLFIDGVFFDDSLREAFETEGQKLEILRAKKQKEEEKLKERQPEYEEHFFTDRELAILEIFQRMRPNDPVNMDSADKHFHSLLFDPGRYDLSEVGRIKVNQRLYTYEERNTEIAPTLGQKTLQHEDILRVIRYLYDLKSKRDGAEIDDIDHLGNRRVRSVGELLVNQFRIGLVRMEKAIKERMSLGEIGNMAPNDIINAKPVTAVIKEFFGASQLSQFMDQTNPLSEVTHKRRLSALGPGGLTRERAGNEVRDVHTTHYGRICPVETPEGPNVGLIASLASYARVNRYGFIETPYRTCKDGAVTGEVKFYSALDEKGFTISQAAIPMKDQKIEAENIIVRQDGDIKIVENKDVNLIDVSPNQMVSVAASLVPFLENDDANRALMGANMQRQAVPLIKSRAPLVGTGMEYFVARDSGVTTTAKRSGIVTDVDATRIVVHADAETGSIGGDVDIYNLTKFRRSNQNTCINQRPLVKIGDRVEAGVIIADGPATEVGELALGQNAIVAFMPWQGYNFEDSILLSERLVQDDVYTSIHIEEFEVSARDTKLGKEEITRDIPNIGDEALKNLDDAGIIKVGSFVKPGDILVGKVTPKGESQLSPEEKLLRAIFGEKAGDVKDTSLKAKPGCQGVVMGAQVFAREGIETDSRALEIIEDIEQKINRDLLQNIKIIKQSAVRQFDRMLLGLCADEELIIDDEVVLGAGEEFTEAILAQLTFPDYEQVTLVDNSDKEQRIWSIIDEVQAKIEQVKKRFEEKRSRLRKGDELSPGVIKMVKVYVAIKRKLQVGDKMAGRHGNKGVVSRILPIESMPYLEDGTPVDVVLNPLGVPSRMNVGQVLETHLGWAARGMGVQIQNMIEEKQRELLAEIKDQLKDSGLLKSEMRSAGLEEIVEYLKEEEIQNLLSHHEAATKQHCEDLREYLLQIYENTGEVEDFIEKASYAELKSLAAKYKNGITIATPVFSGVREDKIKKGLSLAGFDTDGKTVLFDGRTGEPFENRVTVGVMYVLKLHHLVDEKIHARSIGPYSLVTQQPLGGKAQFGGQRLGEMEVWALEAYGAAYTLQEFLTVKSDDVLGRTRMYESIVKGENSLKAGLPESFNVLIKELEALALKVNLVEKKDPFQ